MGQQSARLLMQLIEGKRPPAKAAQVVVPPELVVRDSCGANNASKSGPGATVLPGKFSVMR